MDESDGNSDIVIDGNNQGDGDGGGVMSARVTKKGKCAMPGDELYVYFDLRGWDVVPIRDAAVLKLFQVSTSV